MLWVCWCTCLCAGKTTVIIHGMFDGYLVARVNGTVYRAVFVTASPTLKEQVQGAFSKYQVRALDSIGAVVFIGFPTRLAAGATAAECLQTVFSCPLSADTNF